jgi:hypothetical protein
MSHFSIFIKKLCFKNTFVPELEVVRMTKLSFVPEPIKNTLHEGQMRVKIFMPDQLK